MVFIGLCWAAPPPVQEPEQIPALAQGMVSQIFEEHHLRGFTDEELEAILNKAKETLAAEPALLNLEDPLVVFGDIHGQLHDLIRFMDVTGPPPGTRMLFLGNYVDRGKQSLEVVVLLLCYKILHPEDVFLLRGNHEIANINSSCGFLEELKEKRNVGFHQMFNKVFDELPLKAMTWDALKALEKPKTEADCEEGAVLDLLWADPTNETCGGSGFRPNEKRDWSVEFDKTAVKKICKALDIDFICRSHEILPAGHQWFYNYRLVSIWSAPNYYGVEGNSASVMHVRKKLAVYFTNLPLEMERRRLPTEAEAEEVL